MTSKCLFTSIFLSLGLFLSLWWIMGSETYALATLTICYVALGGNCGSTSPCYTTLQARRPPWAMPSKSPQVRTHRCASTEQSHLNGLY